MFSFGVLKKLKCYCT